jgi:hypothetical protein
MIGHPENHYLGQLRTLWRQWPFGATRSARTHSVFIYFGAMETDNFI